MTRNAAFASSAVIAAAAAATVPLFFSSIPPAQWVVVAITLALAFALNRELGAGRLLRSDRARMAAVSAFYAAASFAAFYPTIGDIFRNDDWYILMLFNSVDGLSLKTVRDISLFEMFGHARFQPLAHLLIYARYLAFGKTLFLYHALNIVLHAGTGFLVFLVINSLIKDMGFAFIFGLLFIVLSSQADTCVWTYHIYIIIGSALLLSAIYLADRYSEKKNASYFAFASLFALVSMLLYEPAAPAPALLVLLAAARARLRGEGISKKEAVKLSLITGAAYAVYAVITVFGVLAITGRGQATMPLSLGAGQFLGAFKAMFFSVWETLLKDTGFRPDVQILDTLYLRLPQGFYVPEIIKAVPGAALLALSFRKGPHRAVSALLAGAALSYLFIISFGRAMTNDMDYVSTQPRYQYLPNALLLIALSAAIAPALRQRYTALLAKACLFALIMWNLQNTLFFNNEVTSALADQNADYRRTKAFVDQSPGRKLYLDIPTGHKFYIGSVVGLDFMLKGNTTKFPAVASHLYRDGAFIPNPAPQAAPGPILDGFDISWIYFSEPGRPHKDLAIIGSEGVYPRISMTPKYQQANRIKIEMRNALTNEVDSYYLSMPPRESADFDYQGTAIEISMSNGELVLKVEGVQSDSAALNGAYLNWDRDGADLFGSYFRGAGELIYILDLRISASGRAA